MSVSIIIARRYFFSRKKGGGLNLISVISGISLLGYIVGAAALIIVLSVFNGFEGLFQTLYNNFDSDIQIVARQGKTFETKWIPIEEIKKMKGIHTVSRVLEENVLLKYDNRQTIATVKGVDEYFIGITSLDSCILEGELLLQKHATDYAIIGQGIAWSLAVDPTNLFKRLHLYVPTREELDMLNPESSFKRASIMPSAIFSVQQEVDNKYVIAPLRFVAPLLDRKNELSSLEIKVDGTVSTDRLKQELTQICGDRFEVKNRFEQREAFYKIMRSEKLISYIILLFVLLIAASNSVASLYLLMLEKQKDIRMLSNMGMKSKTAYAIFVAESMFIALVGGGSGMLLGSIVCYIQQHYGIVKLNDSPVFLYQYYPVALHWNDILLVFVTVVILGLITAQYPARKAAQLISLK